MNNSSESSKVKNYTNTKKLLLEAGERDILSLQYVADILGTVVAKEKNVFLSLKEQNKQNHETNSQKRPTNTPKSEVVVKQHPDVSLKTLFENFWKKR